MLLEGVTSVPAEVWGSSCGLRGKFCAFRVPGACVDKVHHSKCVKAMAKGGCGRGRGGAGSREQEHQRRGARPVRSRPARAAFPSSALLRLCAEGEPEPAGRGQQTGISILMAAG